MRLNARKGSNNIFFIILSGYRSIILPVIKKIFILFLLIPFQIVHAGDTDSILAGQYLNRAQYLYGVDQYDSLVWYYTEAYEFYHARDSVEASQCLLGLAEHYRISGEFDSVESYLDKYSIYTEKYNIRVISAITGEPLQK